MRKRGWNQGRAYVGCVFAVLTACGSHTVLPIGSNGDGSTGTQDVAPVVAQDAGFVFAANGWTRLFGDEDAGDSGTEGTTSNDGGASAIDASMRSDAGTDGEWQLALSAGDPLVVARGVSEAVGQCLFGGEGGRSTQYAEAQSETRTRAIRIVWDRAMAYRVGLSTSPSADPVLGDAFQRQLIQKAFGGALSISSSSANQSLFALIPVHQIGVWHRQTLKLERTALIYYRDANWPALVVGTAYLTDWSWAGSLIFQTSCGIAVPESS